MADKFKKTFNEAVKLFDEEKFQEGSDLLFSIAKQGHLESIKELVYIFIDQQDFETVKLVINYYEDQNNPTILYLKALLHQELFGEESARLIFFEAGIAGSPNACATMAEYLIGDGLLDEAESWVKKAGELKFGNMGALKEQLLEARNAEVDDVFSPIPLSEFLFVGEMKLPSGIQLFVDPSYLQNGFMEEIKSEMGEEDQSIVDFENGYGYFRKRDVKKCAVFVHYLAGEDKRVDSVLICENPKSWKGSKLTTKKGEQIAFEDIEEIGSFTVDSGQVMFGDLEELNNFDLEDSKSGKNKSKNQLNYESIIALTCGPELQGIISNVYATSTGYGDGTYSIYSFTDIEKRDYILIDFLNFVEN